MFYKFVDGLFIVSFAVQKLLSLRWSHLLTFAFVCASGVICKKKKKIITNTNVEELLCYFFFNEFYGIRSYV